MGFKFSAAVIAVSLVAIQPALAAGHLPTVIVVPEPILETEATITERLLDLGFSDIENMRRQGQVFEADAVFEGEAVAIRVDADEGTISELTDVTAADAFPSVIVVPEPILETVATMTERLGDLGFTDIKNMSRDGQVFTTDAMFNGRAVALRVDADEGRITDTSSPDVADLGPPDVDVFISNTDSSASVQEVEESLLAAGYTNISGLTKDGEVFDATAEWRGVSYRLNIDAKTGIVEADPS